MPCAGATGDNLDPWFRYNFLTNVQHYADIFRRPRTYSRLVPGALESSRGRRFPSLHRRRLVSILFPAGAVGAPGNFSATSRTNEGPTSLWASLARVARAFRRAHWAQRHA